MQLSIQFSGWSTSLGKMCSEIISIPGMILSDRPQHIQGVQCSVKGLRMCKDVVRVSKKLLSLRYLQIFSDTGYTGLGRWLETWGESCEVWKLKLTEQIKKDWKLWKNCGNVSQFKRFAECAVSSPWSAKEGQGGRVEVSVALLTRTQREKAHLTKNIKLQCRKTVFFTKKTNKKDSKTTKDYGTPWKA